MRMWDCVGYFVVKRGNLLLIGCREQEVAHLGFEWILHLDIYIVAGSFLLIVWVHTVHIKTTMSSTNAITMTFTDTAMHTNRSYNVHYMVSPFLLL